MAIRIDQIEDADLPAEVGRYRLVDILGEGGMGRVFRAELTGPSGFRKPCALKVIRAEVTGGDKNVRQSLINEARLGGLLNHPNVIATLDFGELEGQPFIAMEVIDGITLSQIVRLVDGPLPPATALEITHQVCLGLDYAHDLEEEGRPVGLIHRDLKPANIIVSRHGVAKLMDFGIAKAVDLLGEHTRTGLAKGTPSFMSPEQVEGLTLDRRSDIFAMGTVLYFMLTGQLLFDAPSTVALLYAIAGSEMWIEKHRRMDSVQAVCPEAVPILERCLRVSAAKRYGDARALAQDLARLRESMPAGPPLQDYVCDLLDRPSAAAESPPAPVEEPGASLGPAESDEGSSSEATAALSWVGRAEALAENEPQTTWHGRKQADPAPPAGGESVEPTKPLSAPKPEASGGKRRLWAGLVVLLLIPAAVGILWAFGRSPGSSGGGTEGGAETGAPSDAGGSGGVPDADVSVAVPPVEDESADGETGEIDREADTRADGDASAENETIPDAPEPDRERGEADEDRTSEREPDEEREPESPPPLRIEADGTVTRAAVGFTKKLGVVVQGADEVEAVLMFRPPGGDWQLHRLSAQGAGRHTTSISVTASMVGTASYYFYAQRPGDRESRVSLGSRSSPFELEIL